MKLNLVNAATGQSKVISIQNYVPEYTQRENISQNWVAFGRNNLYFDELVDLVEGSGIASACVSTKANFISGDGFVWDEKDRFQDPFYTKLTESGLLENIATDLAYFESFVLNIRYNLKGQITEINHVDFTYFRPAIMDETGKITHAWISANWKGYRQERYKPLMMPMFNPDPAQVRKEISEFKKDYKGQILYVRKYKPRSPYFAKPTWAAADARLDIDRQIGDFHVENLDNGMFPGTVMYLPGSDWEDVIDEKTGKKKKDALKEFQDETLTGKGNRGKIINLYGATKDDAPQILPFQQNANGDMFLALDGQTIKYIPSAFQVPPMLAGIDVAGNSLAADQVASQIELFQNGVIVPNQLIITNTIDRLQKYFEGYKKTENDYPVISVMNPLKYVPESYLATLSINERRERIGYAKLEGAQYDYVPGIEPQTAA